AALTSNVLRNVSQQLGSVKRLNVLPERAVLSIHRWIGVDPDDPRTTWPGTHFEFPSGSFHEDRAGNPLHVVLIAIGITTVLVRRRAEGAVRPASGRAYAAALIAGFILFCLVLKWQPWNSRLHLPLFVLSAPLVGA